MDHPEGSVKAQEELGKLEQGAERMGGGGVGESQAEPGVPGCFKRCQGHPGQHLQIPRVISL